MNELTLKQVIEMIEEKGIDQPMEVKYYSNVFIVKFGDFIILNLK